MMRSTAGEKPRGTGRRSGHHRGGRGVPTAVGGRLLVGGGTLGAACQDGGNPLFELVRLEGLDDVVLRSEVHPGLDVVGQS